MAPTAAGLIARRSCTHAVQRRISPIPSAAAKTLQATAYRALMRSRTRGPTGRGLPTQPSPRGGAARAASPRSSTPGVSVLSAGRQRPTCGRSPPPRRPAPRSPVAARARIPSATPTTRPGVPPGVRPTAARVRDRDARGFGRRPLRERHGREPLRHPGTELIDRSDRAHPAEAGRRCSSTSRSSATGTAGTAASGTSVLRSPGSAIAHCRPPRPCDASSSTKPGQLQRMLANSPSLRGPAVYSWGR